MLGFKKFLFIQIAIIVISFSSCYHSQAAKEADIKIKSIGTITKDSNEAILDAENAVNALSTEEKKELRYQNKLIKARNDYEDIIYGELAQEIKSLVDDLKTSNFMELKIDQYDIIKKCKTLSERMPFTMRDRVESYDFIQNGYNFLSSIIRCQDQIDKLSKGEYSSGGLYIALDEFLNLQLSGQEQVSNIDTLNSIVKQYKTSKKSAKAKLRRYYDEFNDETFYYASCHPVYDRWKSYILPVIRSSKYGDSMFIRWCYTSEDPLFISRAEVKCDGETKDFIYQRFNSDVERGRFIEWFNDYQTKEGLMKQISCSKKTIVRFHGSQYYDDLVVPSIDKQGIKDVLNAYDSCVEKNHSFEDRYKQIKNL